MHSAGEGSSDVIDTIVDEAVLPKQECFFARKRTTRRLTLRFPVQ